MANLNINKGVFNILYRKQGFTINSIREILRDYGKNELNQIFPKNNRPKYYNSVSEMIQEDFRKFIKWLRKNRKYYHLRDDYNEWYEESSFDGTFAYNGVADDF